MLIKNYSKLTDNIVPLITLALSAFLLLLVFIVISYDRHLTQLDRVIESEQIYSQKIQISGELMEYARNRTLLTSQLINTDDIFEQDELNMELEGYATKFSVKRSELGNLPLTEVEQRILDKQLKIIGVILPAQRKVVELAMSDNEADGEKAKQLLYDIVLSGQSELIDSFSELIKIAQEQTTILSESSRLSVRAMKQRSSWFIGPVLALIFVISIIVIWRIRRIQSTLLSSRIDLERTVAERTLALRKSQDMLQSVLDTIPVSVYWMDIDGTYAGSNLRFAREAGFESTSDIIGKKDVDMPWYYLAEQNTEENRSVTNSGTAIIDKIEEHISDDKSFWLESSKVPLLDENKTAVGMLGIYHDITKRKVAEEKLKLAMIAAEAANTAKSQFLANMSHEIRTPMNTVIGMSYLVLQTELNDLQKNYIQKVHHSAESLLGIINDILDFSKIEANKVELENTDFWLEDVFDNLSNLVGLRADEKGLELLFDISPDIPTALVGDQLRLGQILVNLVSNAVKFTEMGEVRVSVHPEQKTEDNICLHFSVSDSGVGMSDEQTALLFKPFSQADASTTRQYGGTGLGLSIAKHLCGLMQGEIWVESEPGSGSTFHFTTVLQYQKNKLPRNQLLEEIESLRVLVVDDSVSAGEILQGMLAEYGVTVDMAHDGESALQRVNDCIDSDDKSYDLILVDWKMPDMDGLQVMEKLAELDTCEAPAVVMHTAYGREEILCEASGRGITNMPLLIKPVTQSGLLDTISQALGRSLHKRNHQHSGRGQQDYLDSISRLQGTHVLLVEDNELNQELALALLTGNGISVEVAINGQEAIDRLKTHSYDGVLMDCQMPVMDGYTATRQIREKLQLTDLPILAMTANAMVSDIEKTKEAGMNDHIAKPINVQDMFNTMARWIKPSRAGMRDISTISEPDNENVSGMGQTAENDTSKINFQIDAITEKDMEIAIERVGGSKRFYRKMLHLFQSRQPAKNKILREALEASDWPQVCDSAHEVKGVLGSLGATALFERAAILEQRIKDGADEKLLRNESESLLSEIDDFLIMLNQQLPQEA